MAQKLRELSIPVWVLQEQELFFDERFVLGVPYALSAQDWKLKFTNRQIGNMCGMSSRSVGYCLRHLERDGYIRIRHADKSYREIWLMKAQERRAA